MEIQNVINIIKQHHYKELFGKIIDENTTRDKILFGDANQQCTGIITTIYPSVDVIKKAIDKKANLIISHETLFWNHGDHTDWLSDNDTFEEKKKLLTDHSICVWRDHDYIHAGMDVDGKRVDGIFYGLLKTLGWLGYIEGDIQFPLAIKIPPIPVIELAHMINQRLNIRGMKCVGDLNGTSSFIYIPSHIQGRDNDKISLIEKEEIDTVLAMECVDFTLTVFVKDSAELNKNRRLLVPGHFNLEEPGMKWFGEEYLPSIIKDIEISYVQGGNMYRFVTEQGEII